MSEIHGFYDATSEDSSERISISLMKWNPAKQHLEFVDFFPDSDPPRADGSYFNNGKTAAGRCYFEQEIVICEDVQNDPAFRVFNSGESGSLFVYPVPDDMSQGRLVFVVNVFSTLTHRFLKRDKEHLKLVMDVFGDRLLLEARLVAIREHVAKDSRGALSA